MPKPQASDFTTAVRHQTEADLGDDAVVGLAEKPCDVGWRPPLGNPRFVALSRRSSYLGAALEWPCTSSVAFLLTRDDGPSRKVVPNNASNSGTVILKL
jgi:hypothetical protein